MRSPAFFGCESVKDRKCWGACVGVAGVLDCVPLQRERLAVDDPSAGEQEFLNVFDLAPLCRKRYKETDGGFILIVSSSHTRNVCRSLSSRTS